ncbi:BrnA antitoxin family protein [Endozoicomonas sp. 4G]|uniref:BrnA antitoxin family protein n=1 Tax=Endozoicomonas sp. 4G TaxID=2872754 RepID=UPI002078B308|nr:BrnA antitoxin family protein [Endozoicomonas sp. 4G]
MRIKTKSGRWLKMNTDEEEAAINAGIAADPDTYELTDEEIKQLRPVGRPKAEETKERITIRLSPEVVEFFRSTGKGWQTRINEALKEYVSSQHA